MAYQHTKEYSSSAKEPSFNDPMAGLIARLTGVDLAKPRQPIPFNRWAKANRTLVDSEYDTKYKFNKPNKSDRLKMRAQITKDLYNKLSVEEKQIWVDEVKKEYEEAMEKWNAAIRGPASTNPADQQR